MRHTVAGEYVGVNETNPRSKKFLCQTIDMIDLPEHLELKDVLSIFLLNISIHEEIFDDRETDTRTDRQTALCGQPHRVQRH
jgi:hypothetical protein